MDVHGSTCDKWKKLHILLFLLWKDINLELIYDRKAVNNKNNWLILGMHQVFIVVMRINIHIWHKNCSFLMPNMLKQTIHFWGQNLSFPSTNVQILHLTCCTNPLSSTTNSTHGKQVVHAFWNLCELSYNFSFFCGIWLNRFLQVESNTRILGNFSTYETSPCGQWITFIFKGWWNKEQRFQIKILGHLQKDRGVLTLQLTQDQD